MNRVSLGEVATLNPRIDRSRLSSDDQAISFVAMADVSEVTQRVESEIERPAREVLKGYTPFERGDVLVAKITPCFENGKLAIADIRYPVGFGSTEFHVLRANPASLDVRYLYHFLRRPRLRADGAAKMTGSAGQRRLPAFFLEQLQIPLPSLDEQRRIATVLDRADAIRAKRRQALARLDGLLRAVFVDLFGDPVANPRDWPMRALNTIADVGSGITKGKRFNGRPTKTVPYMRVANVQDGYLDLSDVKEIEATEDDVERYALRPGDILLTEGGDPDKLGRGAVWGGEIDPCIHQNHIFRVRTQCDVLLPEFASAVLGSARGKRYFLRAAKQTTGIASINMTQLSAFPMLVPPIQLQQRFERIKGAVYGMRERLAWLWPFGSVAGGVVHHRICRQTDSTMPLPPALAAIMVAFRPLFDNRVYERLLVLTVGAVLALRSRTVTAALRVTGHGGTDFCAYHRVLSRARWCSRKAARILLGLLVARFTAQGPLVIGLDDTIERRWGPQIEARGIYRDPVRSSHGHFVKASGLRWLCLCLLTDVPWAARVWALPFLTLLCPSERYYSRRHRAPKKLTDHARQAILQLVRWLPERHIVVVADTGFASIQLLAAVGERAAVVTRLRLDAALYDVPPPRQPGQIGRPRKKGTRQLTLAARLTDPATRWQRVVVSRWYGQPQRLVDVATGTALWYHSGMPAVALRWIVVRDPSGAVEPKAFLCTDQSAAPLTVIQWYARRWSVEVTFAEVRRHLGVETQRQWSAPAIVRTTPCLLGLFSVVALAADSLQAVGELHVRQSAWYCKAVPSFSDALASVRVALWRQALFPTSASSTQTSKNTGAVFERMSEALAYAA